MNDFTKEELIIFHDFCSAKESGITGNKPYKYLADKLQSMIDNYCDHEKIGQVSDVDYVNICTACKELTGWV